MPALRSCLLAVLLIQAGSVNGASSKATAATPSGAATDSFVVDTSRPTTDLPPTAAPAVRQFHEVLDDLLLEFSQDIKLGQIKDIKNLSIRRVMVSDTLPRSYSNYVELLVAERFRANSKITLISCLPCKTKTSRIVDGQLMITSPHTNMQEMARAADQLGIDYFMDVILVYHTTHMVMAFQVFNTSTKELVWARTYNSETLKSRFQKLAVDYNQVVRTSNEEEYQPEWRYLFGLGGASIPNVVAGARESNMMSLQVRGTEKFNNRLSEFGLLATLNFATSAILSEYPSVGPESGTSSEEPAVTEVTPTPFTTAIGLFGIYSHNFFGSVENFDQLRFGLTGAVGLHLAAGYIAPALRTGADLFFGKKFLISSNVMYVANANILIDGSFVKTQGGAGGDVVISYSF